MRFAEMVFPETPPVEGYGPGFFRIGGEVIRGGLLLLPGVRRAWDGASDLDDILAAAGQIDVLLYGAGAEIGFAPETMRTRLEEAGIGVEVSASPPACRTYNVLLGEGRRVGLAVLPV